MPQLDLLSFFTQFFWTVLCIFLFYIFVYKLILPELSRVLKYRSKAAASSVSEDRSYSLSTKEKQSCDHDQRFHTDQRSASETLYKKAVSSGVRVLAEVKTRRDNFWSHTLASTPKDTFSTSAVVRSEQEETPDELNNSTLQTQPGKQQEESDHFQ